jgi:hypothetical protein
MLKLGIFYSNKIQILFLFMLFEFEIEQLLENCVILAYFRSTVRGSIYTTEIFNKSANFSSFQLMISSHCDGSLESNDQSIEARLDS